MYTRKTHNKSYREYRVGRTNVYFKEADTGHSLFADHGRSIASDNVHERRQQRRQIEPKRGNATSQNGNNERLYLHGFKQEVSELLRSLYAFVVRVKINNLKNWF